MMDTLDRLINFHSISNNDISIKPKSIVWAHNTHIGDARFTDMKESGMINIGQLVREKKGYKNSVLVGFSNIHWLSYCSKKMGRKNGNNGDSSCKRRKPG